MVVVMKKVSENYVMNAKAAKKMWPGAVVLDLTLGGAMEKLDPAFPIGEIKAPLKKWTESHSIMGIWEGLKVFNKKDIDISYMTDIKKLGKERKCKSYGRMKGIKIEDGIIEGDDNVTDFYKKIYKDVIGERFGDLIENLKRIAKETDIVLLDYCEGDEKYPVSHVELFKELI